MSTQPFTSAKFRELDANGAPLAGGLLYTYAAGTTTPQATYTTRAGTIANANPVVLDANGRADVWLTPGVDYKFELRDSAGVLQYTVDNYPSAAATTGSTDVVATEPGGRLTLTQSAPVTTADVTAAVNIYYVPYRHDKVPLYDGSSWALYSIGATGISQATSDNTKSPAAVGANLNYDLFVWNDAGTIRLSRGPAWSSDTARGTGAGTTQLAAVNGRYVNAVSISNGPAAQRGLYVGTIRSDGASQLTDSMAKRYVWNTYHRTLRPMRRLESTNSWTYGSATVRQANASTANQLDFVRGLDEDRVECNILSFASPTGQRFAVGVGVDSAVAWDAFNIFADVVGSSDQHARAQWTGFPGLGAHSLKWLEAVQSATNITFFGVATYSSVPFVQSGMWADFPA